MEEKKKSELLSKYKTESSTLEPIDAFVDDAEIPPVPTIGNAPPKQGFVSYELATWVIYLSFTSLAIVDRFTTNVWPRQTFSIGQSSAGSDRLEGFKPGPWSVVTYDVLSRISGRFCICCFNLLLITRLKSLEHALLSSSFITKKILDCKDIDNANTRLHKWNGIALCAVTVIHVWSILLPCVTHRWSAQVLPGTFEYPLSERTPKGFKDADPESKTISLQVDDVYRMVEMTVLLCVLMPLGVRWLSTRWHIGMPLHRLIMVLYFVDIVRRHSHPHSWVLNTPVFVIWLLDKVWSMYWRRCMSPKVHRVKLDDNYMILYWNHQPKGTGDKIACTQEISDAEQVITPTESDESVPNDGKSCGAATCSTGDFCSSASCGSSILPDFASSRRSGTNDSFQSGYNNISIGPDYSLRLNDSSLLEGAHIFTVFENRLDMRMKTSSINGFDWSVGTVVRVFCEKRTPQLGARDSHSHTMRMYNAKELDITAWGPSQGEMSAHVYHALLGTAPVVLVAAGSGVGYAMDALQWVTKHGPPNYHLKVLFTTRSQALFEWVKEMTTRILAQDDFEVDKKDRLRVVLALTVCQMPHPYNQEADECGENGVVRTNYGRLDFGNEIEKGSVVFCQGSRGLKNHIATACRRNNVRFFGGLGGGGL